jgi:chlorite dismutase
MPTSPQSRLYHFLGGTEGAWRVVEMKSVTGAPLPNVAHISMLTAPIMSLPQSATWTLNGITSNDRYVVRDEKAALIQKQEGLGRSTSTCAALIPIRKSDAWWLLTQDERREIFEAQSAHIAIGMKYLPAIARRLHHCRDLGTNEPFDFLTWFEYSPTDARQFDDLLRALRQSPEWAYVEREVDIRVVAA